jgi:hypothetical protein
LNGGDEMNANLSKTRTRKALQAAYEQLLVDWYLEHITDAERAERKARIDREWDEAGLG